ncbi:MAG: hypothetical protein CMB31_05060 [Euryarchaeota archaeon]|nr:hypothetical protein [Euryarchaeota archaeon]|tara:strand:- start:408 stop:707 length:300 start_codon:yes stop_codon:yes gene_type:complete
MKKAIIFALLYLFSTESFVLKPPTRKELIKRAYPVAGALFAASFIPYFLDDDIKPEFYKDGLTAEQIMMKHKYYKLNKHLDGDISKMNDVFPEFELVLD